jgi:prevent-host-death family protein
MGKRQLTKKTTYEFVPELVNATDLQRKSKDILDHVEEAAVPYFVVRNNKPTAVIIGIDTYEKMKKAQEEWEIQDTLEAIKVAEEERKAGKLEKFEGSWEKIWKKSKEEFKVK